MYIIELPRTWGCVEVGMAARSLLEPVPRPVSRSPYTIMVGTLTPGSSARASCVETGATGTQPSTL